MKSKKTIDAWEDIEAFDNAVKDIKEGRTVPLDKALTEEPPSEKVDKICNQIEEVYKERDYYKMHSHILETANDELARGNKIMKEALINIWECFEIRSEIYHNDWVGFQALAIKARLCLDEIGYDWRNEPSKD